MNAEKNPREMVKPVSRRSIVSESIFEAAMETFNQAIGLRVIGGGGAVLNMELSAKVMPESGGELGTTVRGDGGGNSKAGNPVVNESSCTGISGGGGVRGMASGHREVRSMMVRRWVCWAEGERGPTR